MNESNPNRGHILVLADREADLQVLTKLLAEHGYEVRSATSEQETLVTEEPPFDLILVSTATTGAQASGTLHRL